MADLLPAAELTAGPWTLDTIRARILGRDPAADLHRVFSDRTQPYPLMVFVDPADAG